MSRFATSVTIFGKAYRRPDIQEYVAGYLRVVKVILPCLRLALLKQRQVPVLLWPAP
jgi:hypothetical protein